MVPLRLRGNPSARKPESPGSPFPAALNDAVERVARAWNISALLPGDASIVNDRGIAGVEYAGLEVEGVLIALSVGPEEAQATAEIQRQVPVDAPIILKVRFKNLVAVVILFGRVPLLVARNPAHQKVCKGVARAYSAVARI